MNNKKVDVWIDITNSPHVHYFYQLIKKFEMENISYIITYRVFKNLKDIINLYTYNGKVVCIGRHGEDLYSKLTYSSERIIKLAKLINEVKPKVAIGKHSVELPRVAKGLGIPTVFIVDNEHATFQNKLTLPLPDKIISPIGTDRTILNKCGGWNIDTFNGVCEVSNVNSRLMGYYPINNNILNDIGLNSDLPTIVMRSCPNSSYCSGKKDIIPKIIERLKSSIDCNIVCFPRNDEQKVKYKSMGAVVPGVVDTLSLMYYSDCVIGAGGTMNREGAVLGVPTISCYPEKLLGVDKYLIDIGRMIHTTDLNEVVDYVMDNIGKRYTNNIKMEDPTKLMYNEVVKFIHS